MRVIVAEDSSMLRRVMGDSLSQLGCEALLAADGDQALGLLTQRPALLVTDLEMPGMGGLELIRRVRLNPETHDLPVVVLTSRGDQGVVIEAMRLGVMAYFLKKRFDPRNLNQQFRRCLVAAQRVCQRRPPRVIVAEDGQALRAALVKLLEGLGCDAVGVADGREALVQIESAPPDLVVSDLNMPSMTGVELLRAVRGRAHLDGLPFIMMTASSDGDALAEAMDLGVSAYIHKGDCDIRCLQQQIFRALIVAPALH